jgi:hypothetical protein
MSNSDSSDELVVTPHVMNIWNLNKFNKDAFESKPVRFFEALQRSLDALATEPRDKVFALLGLVYDSAMYLPVPNYRQSLRYFYWNGYLGNLNYSVTRFSSFTGLWL